MGERARWLMVLAVPVLLATTGMPAFGRGNAGGSRSFRFVGRAPIHARAGAPRIIFRRIDGRNNLSPRRLARSGYTAPFGFWPYWSYCQAVSADGACEDEAAANPYVIVISQQPPAPPQETPPAASGSGSAGGCYPIPNGYHCDSAPHGTAP
jgi:hypothetical protein